MFFGGKKAPAGMPTLAANDFSQLFCSFYQLLKKRCFVEKTKNEVGVAGRVANDF